MTPPFVDMSRRDRPSFLSSLSRPFVDITRRDRPSFLSHAFLKVTALFGWLSKVEEELTGDSITTTDNNERSRLRHHCPTARTPLPPLLHLMVSDFVAARARESRAARATARAVRTAATRPARRRERCRERDDAAARRKRQKAEWERAKRTRVREDAASAPRRLFVM